VRGDRVEIFPAYEEDRAIRVEFWGDTVEAIREIDPLRGVVRRSLKKVTIYPASHYVTPDLVRRQAMAAIEAELDERVRWFREQDKLVEAQRLGERTRFDLEMMRELGFCHGIENYSRHLTGRAPGEAPPTLLDYLPRESLVVIDESHITVPQLMGMFRGDRSRKQTLVDFGFRLPSALDNRPLSFEEFAGRVRQVVYVSATPGPYELKMADGRVVEQIVRPTGLMDPRITVKPASHQVDDLLGEIRGRTQRGERVLVTTLTKRMAEDLTEYYHNLGVKVRYLHSDITTLERMEIIRDLRLGVFEVLVGINLLREGLDLPEVSLVAILDADKEGFLRSARSLIQTCGRAARNVMGEVLFYADQPTPSIQAAVAETNRRRRLQEAYNKRRHITPESIRSKIKDVLSSVYEADYVTVPLAAEEQAPYHVEDLPKAIARLKREMQQAAKKLDFERAAALRDKIRGLEAQSLKYG
jgi:excinuclease ABC subunit B